MSCSCCWIVRGMRHVYVALLILVYRFQDRKVMPEERGSHLPILSEEYAVLQ